MFDLIDQEDVFIGLLIGLAAIYVYFYVLPSGSENRMLLLENQASVSNVRHQGETAIYRSLSAPHTRGLINGLSIGTSFSTRPGTLADIWKVRSKKSKLLAAHPTKHHAVDIDETEHIEAIVSQLGRYFQELRGDSVDTTVSLLVPNCQQALISLFAAALFNIPTTVLPIDKDSLTYVDKHIEAANPFVLIVADEVLLDKVDFSKTNIKEVITIRNKSEFSYPISVRSSLWKTVIKSLGTTPVDFPAVSEAVRPVQVTYRHNGTVKVTKFTHQNLAAAVAYQIKALPQAQQWGDQDRVLIFTSQVSLYTIVSQLTALIQGSSVLYLSKMNVNPEFLLEATQPTVIVTDDDTTLSLLNQVRDLTLLQTIKLRIDRATLSRGRLPARPVLPYFKSVRLFYTVAQITDNTEQLLHPELFEQDEDDEEVKTYLDTYDINTLRSLTGSDVIHSLASPLLAGPLASTMVWDYRYSSADDRDKLSNFGPVSATLEAKLRDFGGLEAENNEGELLVRGFVSPTGEEWIETSIVGRFAPDGCLKLINY